LSMHIGEFQRVSTWRRVPIFDLGEGAKPEF